jgi:hypothetical protein
MPATGEDAPAAQPLEASKGRKASGAPKEENTAGLEAKEGGMPLFCEKRLTGWRPNS